VHRNVVFCVLIARPEFTDTLAVKQGRHPILDRISFKPIVPNSIVRNVRLVCIFYLLLRCTYTVFRKKTPTHVFFYISLECLDLADTKFAGNAYDETSIPSALKLHIHCYW